MNVTRIAEAPEGIVRVRVQGVSREVWAADSDTRKAARVFAMRESKGLVGKPVRVTHGVQGTVADYAPVAKGTRTAAAAPTGRVAELLAELAALGVVLPGQDAPAPKPPREVPGFIVAKAQAREAAACKVCQDHGKVRASGPRAHGVAQPTAKDPAPWAYRTANGAAGATASKPCPACKGKRKAA